MKYIPVSNAVCRFTHYPVNVWIRTLNSIENFNSLVFSDMFKEAIYFASPDLYEELLKYEKGILKGKDASRLIDTLVKYITRMSMRCTPFASFASCAQVSISDHTELMVSSDRISRIRLDMSVVCQLAVYLQSVEEIRRLSRFKLNSSVYELGHRLRYVNDATLLSRNNYVINEVPYTRIFIKVCSQ